MPVTRTSDAHWMTESRYRGQKVVVVSPDYADSVKFADEWLAAARGTDAALAMSMGHVILKEFFVDRQTPYFTEYASKYTDLPLLVRLAEQDGAYVPGRSLIAADLGGDHANAAFKTVLLDDGTGEPVVPNGSLGFRYGESGVGQRNLDLGDTRPMPSVAGAGVEVRLPRFDHDGGENTGRTPVVQGHRD